MNYIIGTRGELPKRWMDSLAVYRHVVFVERLGWGLTCQPGLELDEFDRDETLYVIACGANERVTGCARMLPTVRPCLLSEVFPELLGDRQMPCSPQVWELSRFTVMNLDTNVSGQFGMHPSSAAVELLEVCLHSACERGATEVVTISPLGIERLLRRTGFKTARLAPPRKIGEHHLFVCRIEVPLDTAPGTG